jgi:hypothetical protein
MTMWHLWTGLKHRAEGHPVFTRVVDDIYDDATRMSRLTQNIFLQGQIWLWPLLFIIDMRLVCLMVFSGTISGMILTLRISNRIANEQRSRTYELLCMTPGGTINTLWAICVGSLHRERAFEILNSAEAWVVRAGLFVPFVISSQLFLQRFLGMKGSVTLIWGLGIIVLFFIDHIQAIVFSSIAGMLGSQQTPSVDQRLWAVIIFGVFQVGSYLFTVITSFFILPTICQVLHLIGISSELSQMILTVVIFYVTREALITFSWRWLILTTNARANDIDFLTGDYVYLQFKLHNDAQTVARA